MPEQLFSLHNENTLLFGLLICRYLLGLPQHSTCSLLTHRGPHPEATKGLCHWAPVPTLHLKMAHNANNGHSFYYEPLAKVQRSPYTHRPLY